MFIIYSIKNNTTYGFSDEPYDRSRDLLLQVRKAFPDDGYGMRECDSREHGVELREMAHKDYMGREAARNTLPPLKGGDLDQAGWDAAMLLLNKDQRGFAANMAAHSYGVAVEDGYVLLVGHYSGGQKGTTIKMKDGVEAEQIKRPPPSCKTCKVGVSLAERGKYSCRLGYVGPHYVARQVQGMNYCDSYKLAGKK